MDTLNEFDMVWLQSAPVMASIFYQKYLTHTHAIYCPDQDGTLPSLRILSRRISQLFESVSIFFCLKKT